MPEARSINQIIPHKMLPDFRNVGTVLRIVLLVNASALFAALVGAVSPASLWQQLLYGSALLQPALLASLLALYVLGPMLARSTYRQGAAAVVGIAIAVTLLVDLMGGDLFYGQEDIGQFRYVRHALESAIVTWLLLNYFHWRAMALSPFTHAARLQALQARIRPHFLFNTLNAVLAIVRAQPKRAEAALEDMSDLFRMAMKAPHELVALREEVEIARRYLELERLRIGDRLQVRWQTETMPEDALIPPLILQPLLENAVYHGIERLAPGGVIAVGIRRQGDELHLEMSNPLPPDERQSDGHRMALSNIRERLSLLFDVEAEYQVRHDADGYHVHIRIPYLKAGGQ